MSKHTPGPWRAEMNGFSRMAVVDKNNNYLTFKAGSSRMPEFELEANANLIAAAPDLLASLEELFEIGTVFLSAIEGNDHLTDFEEWADQARKAIAKARGES